jgi:hypothetical protein
MRDEKQRDSRPNQLEFDKKTGTWLEAASGLRYCPECKDHHNKLFPLKAYISGWQCMVCTTFFNHPDDKRIPWHRETNPQNRYLLGGLKRLLHQL